MSFGITNATNVTLHNITNITGSTSYTEFSARVNTQIYGGWFYFIILLVVLIPILYFRLQDYKDQPLINLMYSFSAITVLSIFMRAVEILRHGVVYGLLTDFQMWVFPVIAIFLATINWAIKDE